MLNLIRCHCTSFHNNSLSSFRFLIENLFLSLSLLLLYDKENLIDYLFFSQFYYLSLKIKFYLNIFFLRRNNMFLMSDLVCCFHGCENRFEVSYVSFFFFFFFQFLTSLHSNFSYLKISIQTKQGYTILIYFFKFFQIFSNKFHFARALDSFSFNLFFHSRINSCELRISFDFLRQKFRINIDRNRS